MRLCCRRRRRRRRRLFLLPPLPPSPPIFRPLFPSRPTKARITGWRKNVSTWNAHSSKHRNADFTQGIEGVSFDTLYFLLAASSLSRPPLLLLACCTQSSLSLSLSLSGQTPSSQGREGGERRKSQAVSHIRLFPPLLPPLSVPIPPSHGPSKQRLAYLGFRDCSHALSHGRLGGGKGGRGGSVVSPTPL